MMSFVAQHLEYWKSRARRDPQDALYILHWYDVKAFPPHSTTNNALEVILSSLIGALNNRPKLPHKLIVMLGDTKFWCDEQALLFTMDTFITVLLQELKRVIMERQEQLPVKSAGVDPAIFMVKLCWKPDNALDSVPQYPRKRCMFNKLLDEIVRPRGVRTVILHEINTTLDKNLFLNHGDLSEKGYRQIWKSLSEAVNDFDVRGHQQKKTFNVMVKLTAHNSEVDSLPLVCEEDDDIANQELRTGRRVIPMIHVKWRNTKPAKKKQFSKFQQLPFRQIEDPFYF